MYKALRESNFDGPREGGTVQRTEGELQGGRSQAVENGCPAQGGEFCPVSPRRTQEVFFLDIIFI